MQQEEVLIVQQLFQWEEDTRHGCFFSRALDMQMSWYVIIIMMRSNAEVYY